MEQPTSPNICTPNVIGITVKRGTDAIACHLSVKKQAQRPAGLPKDSQDDGAQTGGGLPKLTQPLHP